MYRKELEQEILERKRAEKEIESLAKFPSENPNPVLRITKEGTIVYANDGSAPLLKTWGCQVGGLLPDEWRKEVLEVFNSAQSKEIEVTCGVQIFSVSFSPVVDAGYVYAYGRDITEHKRAEEEIEKREKMLSDAEKIGHVGSFEWDIPTNKVTWSDGLYQIYGLKPQEFGASLEAFLNQVHVEDREMVQKTLEEAYREGNWQMEERIVRPDGEVRVLFSQGEVIKDENGEPIRMVGVCQDITERVRANEELRESEALKGAILESALDCIITMDSGGKIIEFNSAAEKTFGYIRAEVLGKDLAEKIIPLSWRKAHNRGLQRYLKVREGRIHGRVVEIDAMRADGSQFPAELGITSIQLGDELIFTAHLRDITERIRAEEALRESEEMYRTIFDTTRTAAIMVEEDTIISLENTEFERMTGYTKEEIEGKKSWTEFIPQDKLNRMINYHRQRRTDSNAVPSNYESQFINKKGETRDCLITVSIIPGTKKSVVFVVDITEHKEETERIQAAKMESLRQLVAGVAHQMNNPIGAISSNTDVSNRAISKIKANLASPVQTNGKLPRTLAVLEQMNQMNAIASADIAKIVANLQRFVRLDEAEWQLADIHEGIDSTIALMNLEFENRIQTIKDYGDLPKVYCAPSSLNQAFMILLKNASEAVETEGKIHISTFAHNEHVKIEISDTGKGIPPEDLSRIFDPGFTTKRVKVGVGLGLAICYKIVVDEHKGRLDVSSESGEGTTFTITLPQGRSER
ncbi:PAS domain S-box protein [Candidatus Poribacteria bacterium]|nr:PAS domain S-box protein [Candidatus Poribacteria bacterium]